jgi:glycine/D-amino acid oxidase-like deaminating enzyme
MEKKNVVICGAGIAGISTAYHLAVNHGISDILLIDERAPLSLTSDKSTECYRNWWPGPGNAMVSLMNRSIDLLDQLALHSHNAFNMNRRGYLFFTANPDQIPIIKKRAQESSSLGSGPLRIYRGDSNEPQYSQSDPENFSKLDEGADLILDPGLLERHFPHINENICAALHIRRAGWFSAQQLGSLLLGQCKKHGVTLIAGRVEQLEIQAGKIFAVKLDSGVRITTHNFVNAAGPMIGEVAQKQGIELPVYSELHLKVSVNDNLNIVPRESPMLIWNDSQKLPWSKDELDFLSADDESRWLLAEFPPGVHTRPEGGQDSPIILLLWEYQTKIIDPVFPPPMDKDYPEITMRGLSTMIPGLREYFEKPPRPFMDGGYYTKTQENRPLIGPMAVEGSWLIGALSGFGLMASLAAGELLTFHILEKPLPNYAKAFLLERYDDPTYLNLIDQLEDSGQL